MTVEPTRETTAGLIERARSILLQPKAEWDRIAGESADISKLYIGYVLPLAALAALAAFVGAAVFGYGVLGAHYRVPMVPALVMAIVQVLAGLIGVFVLALITNALAPHFGSRRDQGQAHKLAVYSSTAGFLAGVFAIYPPLSMLAILGLYSMVLLYWGLPALMNTPGDKRVGYLITIIIVAIVMGIVVNIALAAVGGAVGGFRGMGGAVPFGQSAPSQPGPAQGQLTLPGGGAVDLSELEKAGQAFSQGGAGRAAIDPSRLQGYLPQTLADGFSLSSVSSSGGVGASQAEGVYQRGDAQLTLSIIDMGAMGAFAAVAGAANVQQNRQDADGYARTNTVDGRVVNEEVSRSAGTASYGVIGRGVAVTAEGFGGVTIEQARAAVEAVGVQRLEREIGN